MNCALNEIVCCTVAQVWQCYVTWARCGDDWRWEGGSSRNMRRGSLCSGDALHRRSCRVKQRIARTLRYHRRHQRLLLDQLHSIIIIVIIIVTIPIISWYSNPFITYTIRLADRHAMRVSGSDSYALLILSILNPHHQLVYRFLPFHGREKA